MVKRKPILYFAPLAIAAAVLAGIWAVSAAASGTSQEAR
jgi:hypothetical protein